MTTPLKSRLKVANQVLGNLLAAVLALVFLFLPGLTVVRDIADPAMRRPGIPSKAWRMHRYLTPRIEQWARERVASKRAGHLNLYDVPSTEWPMFTCVFYLRTTEALQAAWEKDHRLSRHSPLSYSRAAVEAAKDLILDPVHHTWVREHWGNDYWHTQNVFFRSLVISGVTSYEKLVGHGEYLPLLRDQVDSLANELDQSKLGVLEDYPNECYPIDVLAAIAWIKQADELLGIDRSAFYARSIRGFQGAMLDPRGLVPYSVDYLKGRQDEPSRGIGNSHVLISAPDLWPEQAKRWYDLYEKHFWQERWWAAGFREYPKDVTNYSWYDVDSGPIVDGFSISGNAFAVAAARRNGRFDHAFTITAQVLTACWPLPNGMQLGPRAISLSAGNHAPYLGESGIMFFLTQNPNDGTPIVTGGHLVGSVYLGLLFYLGGGALIFWIAARSTWKLWRGQQITAGSSM
jgi:hypothetical protein